MKLCPLHTDRWESAPPDTSNTGVVITVTVITTPVLRLTMLQMRQKNPKIVKRMNSYFEGIKNMWMAKLSLFSPLPFSFSTLVIGSITFWTCLQHNYKPMTGVGQSFCIIFWKRSNLWKLACFQVLLCAKEKFSFFFLFQNFFFNVVSIVKLRQILYTASYALLSAQPRKIKMCINLKAKICRETFYYDLFALEQVIFGLFCTSAASVLLKQKLVKNFKRYVFLFDKTKQNCFILWMN